MMTIDLSRGEAHALLHVIEYFAETASSEYLSPPSDDSPGERIKMVALLRKVATACAAAFP